MPSACGGSKWGGHRQHLWPWVWSQLVKVREAHSILTGCWFLFDPSIPPNLLDVQSAIRDQSWSTNIFQIDLTYASMYALYVDFAVHRLYELLQLVQTRKPIEDFQPNEVAYQLLRMIDAYLPMVEDLMQTPRADRLHDNEDAAKAVFQKSFGRSWWDAHHDRRRCCQSTPCEDALSRTPIASIWNHLEFFVNSYQTLTTAQESHEPLITLLLKAWPQKHSIDQFQRKMRNVFDTIEKRKVAPGMPVQVIANGTETLLLCLEWFCVFHMGMYRHYSHQPPVALITRLHWIKFWNDLHNPEVATAEWLRVQSSMLFKEPVRAIYCIKEFTIYAIRCMPVFREWLCERSLWGEYEYQCLQVVERFRLEIYKTDNLLNYLGCMCTIGFFVRQPKDFMEYAMEFVRHDPSDKPHMKFLSENQQPKRIEEDDEEDVEEDDDDNEDKEKEKGTEQDIGSTATRAKEEKKDGKPNAPQTKPSAYLPKWKNGRFQSFIVPPLEVGFDRRQCPNGIPLNDVKTAAKAIFDRQPEIRQFLPIPKEETELLRDIQPFAHHSYLVCRRIVQFLLFYYGGTETAVNCCMQAIKAYYRNRCGKSTITNFLKALWSNHAYEYTLFYFILVAYEEWNAVWSIPLPENLRRAQDEALVKRFGTEAAIPERADWILFCPNCHDIRSLVVQSRGSGASYPDHYNSHSISGFDDVLVCVLTNRYYCGRKSGQAAKQCSDTVLKAVPARGYMWNIYGRTFRMCEQCANLMEMREEEDYYNENGIICANCTKQAHFAEIKKLAAWNDAEKRKTARDSTYLVKPFPYLHWTVQRQAWRYESKRRRGRPASKHPSKASASTSASASTTVTGEKSGEEEDGEEEEESPEDDLSLLETEDRLSTMNDLARVLAQQNRLLQQRFDDEHAERQQRRTKTRKRSAEETS